MQRDIRNPPLSSDGRVSAASSLLPTWFYGARSDEAGIEALDTRSEHTQLDELDTTAIADRYNAFCKSLQLTAHPAVLIFLRLRFHELRPIERSMEEHKRIQFDDRDLFAFCDFILRGEYSVFEHWRSVNLELCHTGAAGCCILGRVLQLPSCRIHTVNVLNQRIGLDGTRALIEAVRSTPSISRLQLRLSFIEDRGAEEIVKLLSDREVARGLAELDLSNNMLSFNACTKLQSAVQLLGSKDFKLILTGNRVLDEVLNASSHAVGVILVIIGSVFLATEVAQTNNDWLELRDGERYNGVIVTRGPYTVSCVIYLVSLFTLYIASTLFHATFALDEHVAKIFATLDHCAIYLLIAGTYTPFLSILFPDKPVYSHGLLVFLWVVAAMGIMLAALYDGPYKIGMHIASYLGMGWACLICSADIYARMSPHPYGLWTLLAGGLLYTLGVPFNVRDKRTLGIPDHTIWHIFVIGGSMAHYYCIYLYLLPFPYEGFTS